MAQLSLVTGGQKPLPSDGSRIVGDAYYTPDRLARACVSAVNEYCHQEAAAGRLEGELARGITGRVWEPHAGGGAFPRALLDLTDAAVRVSDIDPEAAGLTRAAYPPGRWPHPRQAGLDFLEVAPRLDERPDWFIGNPPFKAAQAHVEHALEHAGRHVLLVLQLAFLESAERLPLWRRGGLRHFWACAQRPSFVEGGKTYGRPFALFWWDRLYTARPTFTPGWDWHGQAARPTRRAA